MLCVDTAGDVDGDGLGDLLFGDDFPATSYLIYGSSLDNLPGAIESRDLDDLAAVWKFSGGRSSNGAPLSAGDVDGDGLADLLFGETGSWNDPGEVHVVLASDLAVLDEADGVADRTAALHNLAGDTDGDGVTDACDYDPMDPDFRSDRCWWLSESEVGFPDFDAPAVRNYDREPNNAGLYSWNARPYSWNAGPYSRNAAKRDLNSWKFSAESMGGGRIAISTSSTDDVDGDGPDSIVITVTSRHRSEVYVISVGGLRAADSADGIADGVIDLAHVAAQPGSWRTAAEDGTLTAIHSADPTRDMEEDNHTDLGIGLEYGVAPTRDVNEDGLDGNVVSVSGTGGSWAFTGEALRGSAGSRFSVAGDFDGDGRADIVIGAPDSAARPAAGGAVYLVADRSLWLADTADGDLDGRIDPDRTVALPGAWRLDGEAVGDEAGADVSYAGDIEQDGRAHVLIGAPGVGGVGAAYLVSGTDLASADAADGAVDGEIDLGMVASQPTSWKFAGEMGGLRTGHVVSPAGDVNGDGVADLALGAITLDSSTGSAYLLSGAGLRVADAADGLADGVIDLGLVASTNASWKIVGEANEWGWSGLSPRGAGDMDGDGLGDPILGPAPDGFGAQAAYFLSGADLPLLDQMDSSADGVIHLSSVQR